MKKTIETQHRWGEGWRGGGGGGRVLGRDTQWLHDNDRNLELTSYDLKAHGY